jgi:hypothetical protein
MARTDDTNLHFTFQVEDHDIVLEPKWKGEKSTVDPEDRVEFFFAAADAEKLENYWGIEIDPLGRVHDYHGQFYRKLDSSWDCEGLQATGKRIPAGYTVSASIPLRTLSNLLGTPVGRGSKLRVGLYRGEFYGKEAATHGGQNDNWISWVQPNSTTPDFHIPSSFRLITLP